MGTNQRSKGRLLLLVLGQVAIYLALFALLEIVLWRLFPVSLDHHLLEHRFVQSIPGLKSTIVYRSDKDGLRFLSPVDAPKPRNLVRVLCLGASTTNQPTHQTEDTWCGLLETRLRAHFSGAGFTVQTVSYGVGGMRAADDAFWVGETFERLEPDVAVTLLGINDLTLNGAWYFKNRSIDQELSRMKARAAKKNARRRRREHWLAEYSQVYRRLVLLEEVIRTHIGLSTGRLLEWHSENLPALTAKYRSYPAVERLTREPDPINLFRGAVNWIVGFFKARGVPVLVLGQPVLWKESLTPAEFNRLWFAVNTPHGPVRPSGAWLSREMARYNAVQRAAAEQAAMGYLDLDAKIPKTLEYFIDDCHFTNAGSAAVADQVVPVLAPIVEQVARARGLAPP